MPLIEQDVPENEKTPAWVERNLRAIIQDIDTMDNDSARDRTCEAMWHADTNPAEFEYLTKYGEYELPAVIRYIPLIRPKGQRLIGDFIERPFIYSIFASDKQSIRNKLDQKQDAILHAIRSNLFDKMGNIQMMQQQIQQVLAMQQQQQAPQSPDGQIVNGTEQNTQMVMPPDQAMKFKAYQEVLRMEGILTQKDIKKVEEMHHFSSLEMHEFLAREAIEYLRYTTNMEKLFVEGMEQKIINDKPLFYVDWETPFENPVFKRVQAKNFHYAFDDEIDYTQQSEWQSITEYMSIGNVITRFRFELSDEDRAKLEARRRKFNTSGGGFRFSGNYWINSGTSGIYKTYSNEPADLCRVRRIFYKTPRKVFWKEVPNQYNPAAPYQHIVDESDLPTKPKKEEKYSMFFMNDIYQGIVIDDDIFIRCGRKPVVLRSVDNFGDCMLPVIGIASYSKGRRPYSVVWSTRDIQKLWNIVHFHKELWIALSGVKGMVMDYSQKPAGMSDTEWQYNKKMGTFYIETINPETGQQRSFNQFRDYDASLSQGYQYLISTAEHLDNLANKVIGMSPQRMSEVSPYDKVGTVEKSIRQSTLATEHIFYDYEHVKLMAVERLVNLCRLAWKNGKVGSYVNPETLERKILNIPPGVLFGADYKMHMRSGGLEMKKLDLIRQAALTDKAQEKISMSQMIDMVSIDSLLAVQKKVQYYEQKAQELNDLNRQADHENNMALEEKRLQVQQELLKTKAELEAQVKQMENRLKEMDISIKDKQVEYDNFRKQTEDQLKKYIADKQEGTKLAGIESERQTEFAYLDEQKRQFDLTFQAEQGEKADEVDIAGPMTMDRKRKEKIK